MILHFGRVLKFTLCLTKEPIDHGHAAESLKGTVDDGVLVALEFRFFRI